MNKEAIALASDSAVTTFGEQKIFTSANKLFSLSKNHPVGIMIYGNAAFMGIPWETLIKIFRKNLGSEELNKLEEYAIRFLQFLDSGSIFVPENVQKEYIKFFIYSYFDHINDLIIKRVDSKLTEKKSIPKSEVPTIVAEVIQEQYNIWHKTKNIPSIPNDFNQVIIDQNETLINKSIKEIFGKLPLNLKQRNQLKSISGDLFAKFPHETRNRDLSGIVIAGFGKDDLFPAFKSYDIEGIFNNNLKYIEHKHSKSKIAFETGSTIQAFAQSEMVFTFMEGVDPYYLTHCNSYLRHIFAEYSNLICENIPNLTVDERKDMREKLGKISSDILKDYNNELDAIRKKNFSQPITKVVSVLPKYELAEMAESLVNITSFKRKVSMDSETVAGPIDVAIISKGDGFIWIKRKHYFKPELNNRFLENYQER